MGNDKHPSRIACISLCSGLYACSAILSSLTDRYDARRILLLGSLCSGLSTLAFALFASSWLTGVFIWGLAGASFAGAYMPGLRALTDRLETAEASRSITLYTASYSMGVGFLFWYRNSLPMPMGGGGHSGSQVWALSSWPLWLGE